MTSQPIRLHHRVIIGSLFLAAAIAMIGGLRPVTYAETAVLTPRTLSQTPWVNLSAAAPLANAPQADPLSLASADFTGDGQMDVVAGYQTAAGLLALYPNASGEPLTTALPVAPHWLAAGDFNADGRQDVAVASRNGNRLFLLAGDGAGGFAAAEPLLLPGQITAFTSADLLRQDGLADLAVGVNTADGARLLVFTSENGAQTAVPHSFPLAAPATTLAAGQLDAHPPVDLALTAGRALLILRGFDQFALEPAAPALETFPLPFTPTSLALGSFHHDAADPAEIALLDSAGQVHLLDQTGQEVGQLATAGQTQLLTANSSTLAGDDLLLLGENGRSLQFHHTDGDTLAALDANAAIVAALPMRLNHDALDDLVLLVAGSPEPQIVLTTAVHTFVITDRGDAPDTTPGDGLCKSSNGFCTLRAAIQEANASPGSDTLVCGLSTWGSAPALQPASPLPTITEALVLEGGGLGQFDCGKLEINGIAAGSASDTDGLQLLGGSAVIRNVAIYNFHSAGITINSDGNIVERSILGTNNQGDSHLFNTSGITVEGGSSNIIQANNISGNLVAGVAVIGGSQTQIKNANIIGFWPSSPPRALPNLWGISVSAAQSTLIGSAATTDGGNYIAGNHYGGIDLSQSASFTSIENNQIGIINANAGLSNKTGIVVHGASNTIGGSAPANNYIAYNTDGIHLYNEFAANNRVSYNVIGGAPGNLGDGIQISANATSNQIGNNEISNNGRYGIYLTADSATCDKNQIRNNSIGTNQAHTADRGNGTDGVLISGVGCTTVATNTINHNGRHGVYVDATRPVTATIELNVVAYNEESGIVVATNNNLITDNILSLNRQIGLWVKSSYNQLDGNQARGEDLSGNFQVVGIQIDGSYNTLVGGDIHAPQSEINGHHGHGMVLNGSHNSVENYYIHSNWDAGIYVIGDNNVIGGVGNGRNIISVNYAGVKLVASASNNQVVGNYIGTDLTGDFDAGNVIGVEVYGSGNQIGGAESNAGNRIRYSQAGNVVLSGSGATGNTVEGNNIAATMSPTAPGVHITDFASSNTVRGNQISGSSGAGIAITAGVGNQLPGNSLFLNGGLGIDLAPNGVTLNDTSDGDGGANLLQNFPIISTVTAGTSTRLQGSLNSRPNTTYTLAFYGNTACDASGYGEGETWLGQTTVTTNSSGQAGFDLTLAVGGMLNKQITATATDPSGNTSEFSRCALGRPPSSGVAFTVNTAGDAVDTNTSDGLCDSSASAGEQCTLRAAVQQANASVGADIINLPAGTYALTLTGSDTTAVAGDLDVSDALTINGAGADITIIHSQTADRVFEVRNNAPLTLNGVTVKGGSLASSANGGGILVNSGTALTLTAVTVQENQTTSGSGGGIYSQGALTISNSAIVSNTAGAESGLGGGGLHLLVGTAVLTNTTLSGNSANGHGGGIYNLAATVSLNNVTIAYNTADLDNDNNGDGGGIYTTSTFTSQNSLLAANQDRSAGSYPYGLADCAGTITTQGYNLIGDRARASSYPTTPDGCLLSGGGSGDSVGGFWLLSRYLTFAAGLGPLQLNGGDTPNHMPLSSGTGLAVDMGNPAVPGSGACEPLDQRGQPRPIDGGTDGIARCDRGAVEHVPVFLSINDATVVEGSPAQFTVSLSEPALITFTVQFSTTAVTAQSALDYTHTAGTLTFTPGQSSQTITVPTFTDTFNEDTETFRLRLFQPQYAFLSDGEGIGTLTDGSAVPALLINDRTVTEGDDGSSVQAVFAATLNSVSGKTVTVNYTVASGSASAGADFLVAQGQITFAPGVTSQAIAVTVLGDNVREGNETFTVQLSSPVNASLGDAAGLGTITDDDVPAFFINDSLRPEGDSGVSSMVFTVWLSKPSSAQTAVAYTTSPGTALAGSDYIPTSGTLIFAAGETMKTILVDIVGDGESESNETFTVLLSSPTGGAIIGDGEAAGLILDDGGYFVFLPMIVR